MDKKAVMKKIVDKLGRDKAVDLVTQAYNTELLTTHLSRLADPEKKLGGYKSRDHLGDALERVSEVCDLTS
ncbi:hypothetical protein [Oleiharenicola lentus]|uniref:hypothetical protein n=1 Tax=Oleiharenicola lentus TaxID=2508720 RepID=UPI003F677166